MCAESLQFLETEYVVLKIPGTGVMIPQSKEEAFSFATSVVVKTLQLFQQTLSYVSSKNPWRIKFL